MKKTFEKIILSLLLLATILWLPLPQELDYKAGQDLITEIHPVFSTQDPGGYLIHTEQEDYWKSGTGEYSVTRDGKEYEVKFYVPFDGSNYIQETI